MCELEQHVMMLKEAGGPLSPSRILSHMRGVNCQIGDGSQEDAHEFLRCASYVRARKQLSIDEAPNILTIVFKRFQEGNYGKINKCISFPEMLDRVPFMTGTSDIPPLYGVGCTRGYTQCNPFLGHYVSYVKDLQGNWYRIDDSVVQPVPTSQVMSEGAYILFYLRSCQGRTSENPQKKKNTLQSRVDKLVTEPTDVEFY